MNKVIFESKLGGKKKLNKESKILIFDGKQI